MTNNPIHARLVEPAYGKSNSLKASTTAEITLRASCTLWFLVAVAGQWIFVLYIAAYYVAPSAVGGLAALGNTHLPKSYIAGDLVGNLAVAAHLWLAAIIGLSGPLQLVPQIRRRFPVFHRWSGRVFMLSVTVAAISGLYMVWVRGSVGDLSQHVALSLNAVLILLFAGVALRHAIARRIAAHRRWALRLFLVANGVWFARVGLWLWVYLTGGIGIDFATFTGPFLTVLIFGQSLLPLAVLEIYLRAEKRASTLGQLAMAALMIVLTIGTVIGIHQASMRIWLPRI